MNPKTLPQPIAWIIFIAVIVGMLALLTHLPKPYSSVTFFVMLTGAAVLAGYQNGFSPGQVATPARHGLRQLSRRLLAADARWSRVLAWAAFGIMLISAAVFRQEGDRMLDLAVGLMLASGLVLAASLWYGRKSGRVLALPVPSAAVTPAHVRWLPVGLGMLALAVLVEINTNRLGVQALKDVSYHVQFALLYAGMILVTWGAAGVGFPRRLSLPRQHRREVLLVCGLALAALVLRYWQVGDIARFEVDETQYMTAINSLWTQNNVHILRPMENIYAPYTWLSPYLQMGMVNLFGRTFEGLRMVSVITGTLAVVGIYALARALFDRTTAIIAALMLLTFPPHLHFSRLALLHTLDATFGVLSFATFAWGMKTGKRSYYALGGMALGLTQYFFDAGKLLFPPLAILWFILGYRMWQPRPQLKGIFTGLAVAALFTIPVHITLMSIDRPIAQRLVDNFHMLDDGFHPERYPAQVADASLFLIHNPDMTYYYYGGQQPLVIEPLVPVFLLGVFYALWRGRSPGMMLLLLWIAATIFGNSIIQRSGVSPRFVVIFPALALAIAVGVRYIPLLIWPRKAGQRTVIFGLAVVLAAVQGVYYFGVHLPAYQQEFWLNRPGTDMNDALLRSLQFPPGTQIHMVNKLLEDRYYCDQASLTIQFLADDLTVDVFGPARLTREYLMSLPRDADHAFFLTLADFRSLALIKQYFTVSDAGYSPYTDIPVAEQFVLYYAAAEKTADRP